MLSLTGSGDHQPFEAAVHTLGFEFVREKAGQYGESLGAAKLYVDERW